MAEKGKYLKTYIWIVQNLKQLRNHEVSVRSPPFTIEITSLEDAKEFFVRLKWRLLITVLGEPDASEKTEESIKRKYIALFLRNINTQIIDHLPILKVSFSITNPVIGKIFTKCEILLDVIDGQHFGFPKFVSIEEIEELKLENLMIQCDFEEIKLDLITSEPLLNNKMFSDIELRVGDKTFSAHKLILAYESSVLRQIFARLESISHLEIEDVKPNVFGELLRYIYTGRIENLKVFAPELFVAAVSYEILDLIFIIENFLILSLKMENVVQTLLLCDFDQKHGRDKRLLNSCINFIRDNFKTFMNLNLCEVLVMKEPKFLVHILMVLGKNLSQIRCTRKSNILVGIEVSESCDKDYGIFFNNETFSDVEIHIDDKKFPAHKLVLAVKSPVFSRMFAHKMAESISGVVKIEDVEPAIFYELLRFMYTNKIENTENFNTVCSILIAAEKYGIDILKLQCEIILEKLLTLSNVFQIFVLADKYNAGQLKNDCIFYIIDNLILNPRCSQYKEKCCTLFLRESCPQLLLELMKKLAIDYEH